MNREIKFRAQRTDTKEFVYGYYHEVEAEGVGYSYIFWQGNAIPVRADSVGQFTGLLDKNGKEIYEGDVIKWDDMSKGKYWRFAVVEMHPDILFNCKFINEVNGIKNSANYIFRFGNFIYKDTHNHIEIIGNIYENPNLIN